MAKVPHGIETLPKISIAWVGCTNVTDDRQTTDGRTTTYSEHELEFTFAKNASDVCEIKFTYFTIFTYPCQCILLTSAIGSESWNFQVVLRKWAFLLLHVSVTFRDATVMSKYLWYTLLARVFRSFTPCWWVCVCCFAVATVPPRRHRRKKLQYRQDGTATSRQRYRQWLQSTNI